MTDAATESAISPARVAGMSLAAAAGWVAGFYAAVFLILAFVGLDAGWQFEAGTAVLGTLGAALGARLASRGHAGRPLGWVTIALAAVLAPAALVLDPDFARAILGGGAVAVVALTAAAAAG